MDEAHDFTDGAIDEVTRRMERAYAQAEREMREKADAFLKDFSTANAEWKAKVQSGERTSDEYDDWLRARALDRNLVGRMADTLARDATDTDRLAREMVNDEIPRVYAENANRSAYGIETAIGYDTHSFDLYDVSTVRMLIRDQPNLVPMAEVDGKKDYRWNRQKFSSAITQSVLQGESIPATAKRLKKVLGMDKRAAISAARTSMTSAENAGRMDSYRRAERIGIKMEKQWMATLDERTRHTHRELDGQHVPIGKPFEVDDEEIMFPADPEARGDLVWNCRCTLVAWNPEMEAEDANVKRFSRLPKGMTYDEWKVGKEAEAETKEKGEAKRYTNPSSPLWSQLGPVNADAVAGTVDRLLAGAKGNAASVWAKFEGRLTMADPVHAKPNGTPKGAYYVDQDSAKYGARGVHMTVQRSLDDVGGRGTLATWFHEFGHNIDYLAGRFGAFTSGSDFGQVLKAEVEEQVKERQKAMGKEYKALYARQDLSGIRDLGVARGYRADIIIDMYENGRYTFAEAARRLGLKRNLPIQTVRDVIGREITEAGKDTQLAVGDIFEGATMGKCQDTYGHGKRYWDKFCDMLGKEGFAEFYSAECIYAEKPEILDIMVRRLPKSYARYREIMEEIER